MRVLRLLLVICLLAAGIGPAMAFTLPGLERDSDAYAESLTARTPAGGTPAAQVNDAIEFYRGVAQGSDAYMLLVVKPSGMAQYWSLRAAIDAMPEGSRPALGLDLIPEDSYVSELFPSAILGGGA